MANETPQSALPHNGGVWPPPAIRYCIRVIALGASAGATGAAYSGHLFFAGTLSLIASALILADVIAGK
jgi:hypothetical protein